MIRVYFIALLTVSVPAISWSRADVEVAPPPREVRPGTHDPVPPAPKAEDPRETVDRIIKNSKSVGDKLAMKDTSTDTRKTQDTILRDIKSLIDRQENPPPQQGANKNMNDDPSNQEKKNDMMPMSGMNDTPPPPNSGMDNQPKGRKPRQQGNDEPKQKEGSDPHKEPNKSQSVNPPPKDPKQNKGGAAGESPKGSPQLPSIPPEEAVMKEVWGYLPDKLRQQTMQYYKQEFMPRYVKLLEHYYSSLSDKGMKK